jgi:short-chain Z-isoprenyl diphosphate synthase
MKSPYGDPVKLSELLYRPYEQSLRRQLQGKPVPKHVAVMTDGNRRWARAAGSDNSDGYRAGADKMIEFLDWCEDAGVPTVTLYVLSTENLRRSEGDLGPLFEAIDALAMRLRDLRRWRVIAVGALDLLPEPTAELLREVATDTADHGGLTVNIAVGYGGRREIADAVRSLLLEHAERGTTLEELADLLDVEHLSAHLYTKGQPDPDLVIRTSGEQRLSGFLMWQSVYSEFYFCEALWPDFRRVDFLRALRSFGQRERRYGR